MTRLTLTAALLLAAAPVAAQGPAPVALTAQPTQIQRREAQVPASISDQAVVRERRINWTAGAIGFLVGGIGGAAIGCAANADDYGVFCGGQNDTRVVVSALVGGVVVGTAAALLFGRKP